jgi:N-acetylglucosaminyldiphosphoundecaprenol N-acetyl-beta-D-mannosaminyltransferase
MLKINKKDSLIKLIKSKVILNELSIRNLKAGDSIVVFNTESIHHFYHNIEYKNYVEQCTHITIDGIGIKIILQLFGFIQSRLHGPELLNFILSQKESASLVVVGGGAQNNRLKERGLIEKHIELPYTDSLEDIMSILVQDILSSSFSNPTCIILLISLGLPKQELVAKKILDYKKNRQHKMLCNVVPIPIGAAIDFLTGTRKRSSRLWQIMGLEWLPRLIREPRMLPRIFKSMFGAILMIKRELMFKIYN